MILFIMSVTLCDLTLLSLLHVFKFLVRLWMYFLLLTCAVSVIVFCHHVYDKELYYFNN